MLKHLCLFTLLAAAPVSAADAVAVLTGNPDVKLNGKPLQAAGAPNWPLASGDEVVNGPGGTATILFPDNARITLAPNAKIKLKQCDRCVVQLFEGAIDYSKPVHSKFEICAIGHPVRPAENTSGSVTIQSNNDVVVKVAGQEQVASQGRCACNAAAPWITAAVGGPHTKLIVIVAASGAAATGAAVGLTRGDNASSKE